MSRIGVCPRYAFHSMTCLQPKLNSVAHSHHTRLDDKILCLKYFKALQNVDFGWPIVEELARAPAQCERQGQEAVTCLTLASELTLRRCTRSPLQHAMQPEDMLQCDKNHPLYTICGVFLG